MRRWHFIGDKYGGQLGSSLVTEGSYGALLLEELHAQPTLARSPALLLPLFDLCHECSPCMT